MLIGFYVQIVLLGTIGCVLYQCLQLTRNCYFHFCVQNVSRRAVLRWKTEQDSKRDIPDPDLVCQVRQLRHTFFFYSMAPKVKHSKKGCKDKAVKRKKDHKIKWNPNSAHKNEKIQQWTQEKMVEAIELYSTGAYSQRKIAKLIGIHVSTLNKQFRGLVKGTGHRLGGHQMPRVLKEGTLCSSETQARHSMSRFHMSR